MNPLAVLREEFAGYSAATLRRDVLAGINVAAVALPLSLAFGEASGASAAAGLVSAILAGLIIGPLGGTPNLISGPTGAMGAVLDGVSALYSIEGVLLTTLMAGALIALVGVLRLGRLIALVPRPVVVGFTSGIALIIFIGQLSNILGVPKLAGATGVARLITLLQGALGGALLPDWHTLLLALGVAALGFLLPPIITRRVPAALLGVLIATLAAELLGWPVSRVGTVPASLMLPDRLMLSAFTLDNLQPLLLPAASVAVLCCLQALLTAAACGNLTRRRMDTDWELIAQGVGNLIGPWFGAVPATGAIARSKVAISTGGSTRMVTVVHALALLLCVLLAAPWLARVPLAALSGVLIVSTVRMNEWAEIRWMFSHGFKSAWIPFAITVAATATFDLSVAILAGLVLSLGAFVYRFSSEVQVTHKPVDVNVMRGRGYEIAQADPGVQVSYLTGPLFFGTIAHLQTAFVQLPARVLILSMRGVPAIDTSGVSLIEELGRRMRAVGGQLLLAAVQPAVKTMLDRAGATHTLGEANFFWSADLAIARVHGQAT